MPTGQTRADATDEELVRLIQRYRDERSSRKLRRRIEDQRRPRFIPEQWPGWLCDGTVFYSSLVRGEPEPLRREWVVPGFWEGLQRMRPGEVCRLTIPAALAYGEHGAGNRAPANAVLVYVVALLADQRR